MEEQEFAESKKVSEANNGSGQNSRQSTSCPEPENDGFMNIPDDIDEELPFN